MTTQERGTVSLSWFKSRLGLHLAPYLVPQARLKVQVAHGFGAHDCALDFSFSSAL